jgi:hypothetical protein
MKANITEEDCKKLNSTIQEPNLVLTIVPQQISNPKHNQMKSIALEVRVPAAHESVYIEMIDRLNERACTLKKDEIGTFFPYYAKRNKPELFDSLMRKQNFAMNMTSAIPLLATRKKPKKSKSNTKAWNSYYDQSSGITPIFLNSCNWVFTIYQTILHPLCGWAGDRFFVRLQVSCCKSLMVDYFK